MKFPKFFIFLFLLSSVIFLLHFLTIGEAVYGDGRYYFAYLPTFFVNHSLNFTESFRHFAIDAQFTKIGLPANPYAIGPAMVWATPYLLFFYLFHPGNAYTALLQIPIGAWNCGLVIAGLYCMFLMLKKYYSEKISLLSVLAIYFTTNLFFYGAIDVINSHSSSFFFASLFVYLWLKEKKNFQEMLLQGLSLGMLFLIRTQDSVFFLLPLLSFLLAPKRKWREFLITIFGFSIFLVLQFLLWDRLWGSWLVSPYLYTNTFNFLTPHFLGVLFNSNSGLFLWTPVIAIFIGGLVFFAKKHRQIGLPMLTIFLLELYIISSWNIWWEGASYSGRMFISSFPLLGFGAAYVIQKLSDYKRILFLSIFSMLNFALMFFYLLKFN